MSRVLEIPSAARTTTRESRVQTREARWPVTIYSLHESRTNWAKCMSCLSRFRLLRDDWDGDHAVAPSQATIDFTIGQVQKLELCQVDPPDRVSPGVNGTIVFEWQDVRGITVLEFVQPNEIEPRFYPA